MDLNWIIEQNKYPAIDGKICPKAAIAAILNAVAMSETETIMQYTNAKNAICEICKNDDELCRIICKMLDQIIQDEGNHQASAQKAANLCQGISAPKPEEFKKAVKENDTAGI